MPSQVEFLFGLIACVLVAGAYALRNVDSVKDYFMTPTGKGILKGILLALAFTVCLMLLGGCSGTYLNNASVYAGLDQTKKISPQCRAAGEDDKITSNLGARTSLYRSVDKRYNANLKYTHHSCAFGVDNKSYDALGLEFDYIFWGN
jgi:hypothetical protein